MIIDSHIHVFDRSVAGAEENFPLWPGTQWGAGEADILRHRRVRRAGPLAVDDLVEVVGVADIGWAHALPRGALPHGAATGTLGGRFLDRCHSSAYLGQTTRFTHAMLQTS